MKWDVLLLTCTLITCQLCLFLASVPVNAVKSKIGGLGMKQSLVIDEDPSRKVITKMEHTSALALQHTLVRKGIKFRSAAYLKATLELAQIRVKHFQAHAKQVSYHMAIFRQQKPSLKSASNATTTSVPFSNAPSSASVNATKSLSGNGTTVSEMGGLASLSGSYYINLGLGTPPQVVSVQFDTGSSLLWVSCDCITCPSSSQLVRLNPYYPEKSSTSSSLACKDRECTQLAIDNPNNIAPNGCSSQSCPFQVTYGDQSSAQGSVVSDIATLPSFQKGFVTGKNYFGCARTQTGNLVDSPYTLDGLMGAGGTYDSLVGQLAKQRVLPFAMSFCLDSVNVTGSKLVLGRGPAPKSMPKIELIQNSYPGYTLPYYYVNLQELRVGRVSIVSSRSMSTIDSSTAAGGVILDSGTTYTILPDGVFYDVLQQLESSTGYTFNTLSDGRSCIIGPVDISRFPKILMTFGPRVSWPVSPSSYMVPTVKYMGQSITCIGMLGSSSGLTSAIIGETFITDFFVQIDVEKGFIGFAPANCSSSSYFVPRNSSEQLEAQGSAVPSQASRPAFSAGLLALLCFWVLISLL